MANGDNPERLPRTNRHVVPARIEKMLTKVALAILLTVLVGLIYYTIQTVNEANKTAVSILETFEENTKTNP